MSVSDGAAADIAAAASVAARALAVLGERERNAALVAVHGALAREREAILAANARDVAAAGAAAAEGRLSQAVLKRLDLGRPGKYEDMLQGVLDVAALPDPVGAVTLRTRLDDGLELKRVSTPIGVLLIIFEARPEVIANIAALAIKSGNAAVLKGGRESTASFVAIAGVVSAALAATAVPNAAIQLVTTRDVIPDLLRQDRLIDLVIPRGSNELVSYIKANTRIPVLGHADGLCSIYLAEDADRAAAVNILLDAKLGYTAACNSVETLLVDQGAMLADRDGKSTFGAVATALAEAGVELRCDEASRAALGRVPSFPTDKIKAVVDADYDTEFLDLILAVKTVPSAADATATTPTPAPATTSSGSTTLEESRRLAQTDMAVVHVNSHGSRHTDAVLTASAAVAARFQAGVDAACVFWNTSTRFSDGMRFGFGTEVGISTNKIHSRGPVGLEGLMIYKYLISGSGQTPAMYGAGPGQRAYQHQALPL